MKPHIVDPIFFRLDVLLALGVSQVHELARKAAGRLTCYRLMLGRCLLAMRESKGFKKFGCSCEIHYAISKLGLSHSVASDCRRVARLLMHLPELTLAAEQGNIDWSKLREIVSKATVETEAYWLRLSKDLNYKQIERLIGKTPKGAFPGDVFEESERVTSELRCQLSDQVLAMLDQARRLYSLEANEPVTTPQVLEWALASYIAQHPVDEESLEKVRAEMDRDLQAQKAQEIPLVAAARGVAAEMGFIPVPQIEEMSRAGEEQDPLAEALGGAPCLEELEVSARDQVCSSSVGDISRAPWDCPQGERPEEPLLELLRVVRPAGAGADIPTQFPPIANKRLAFNPRNRHATKAQKREILRRSSWQCACPGCPARIWLHLHHLIPYSQGGATLPSGLLGICSGCHANVHDGTLRIFQQKDGILVFTDAEGNSLAQQADLELGSWLDFHNGWEGGEEDSFSLRACSGDWAVFGDSRKL